MINSTLEDKIFRVFYDSNLSNYHSHFYSMRWPNGEIWEKLSLYLWSVAGAKRAHIERLKPPHSRLEKVNSYS